MEAVAKFKNCPLSARKMRLVVDLVRGKDVDSALDILKYTRKEAATWIEKTLLAAVANWEFKSEAGADEHDLFIKVAIANEGSTLKRFRPVPYGRAHRIRKRMSHITLIVENRIEANIDVESEEEEVEYEEEN